MTEYLKRTWRRMPPSLRVCVIGAFAALTALGLSLFVTAKPTSEAETASSRAEIPFGLDPEDPMQWEIDLDRDGLTLLGELGAETDPLVADTDQDGLLDGEDDAPLSRAVVYWGNPDLTDGDVYSYPGPTWWLGAARVGGEWLEEGGWVSSGKKRDLTGLYLELDRRHLSGDLVLDLMAWGEEGASLMVMLVDAEGKAVVNDVFGNLLTEPEFVLKCRRTLPLEKFPHAAGVYLQCSGGQVAVYWTSLYVDEDRDGLDAEQELQLDTSDLSPNGRLGEVNDWATQVQYPAPEAADEAGPSAMNAMAAVSPQVLGGGMAMMSSGTTDTDGDGMPDQWETQYGLNPSSGIHSSLAAWWPFDDGIGSVLEDVSGNDYDGDLYGFGTNAWVSGMLGYALEFDGTNDYVEVVQSNAIISASNTEFTISAWVWFDPSLSAQYHPVVSDLTYESGDYIGYWVGFDEDPTPDELELFWGASGSSAGTVGSSDQTEYTNRWAHIVATCDGTNKVLYVNGAEADSASSPAFEAAALDELLIGADIWDYFWRGAIDDLRIYDEGLTSNQVATIYDAFNDDDGDGLENLEEYQAGSYPNDADSDDDGYPDATEVQYSTCPTNSADYPALTSGLVAWWKMDEGSGTTAADSTTNENDATLYNGATWNSTLGQPGLVLGSQTNTYAVTEPETSIPRLDRYSVCMWLKLDNAVGKYDYAYLGANMSSSNYKWRLWSHISRNSTTTRFLVHTHVGRNSTWLSSGRYSTYYPSNEVWTHLAVSYDGENLRYYHDGELDHANSDEDFYIEASGLKTYLGNNMSNLTTYAWEGGMHDVRLYDWALGSNAVADVLSDDVDGDGLGTAEEHANGCDPYKKDTDGDGIPDGWEVEHGYSPRTGASIKIVYPTEGQVLP